ncbi:MAG TPA: hypothetical protein VER76_04885, partial [Pyrinomonadaceae bacterium]|nr:hypothetical protein [Pyrinomonadaceae bacterium]
MMFSKFKAIGEICAGVRQKPETGVFAELRTQGFNAPNAATTFSAVRAPEIKRSAAGSVVWLLAVGTKPVL